MSAGGGRGPGGTIEVPTLTIFCREGRPPPITSSPIPLPAGSTCSISSPRSQTRGRGADAGTRWPGLLAVGIAAAIAGSRSFAAIGQWAADAGPEVLAVLGAVRGPAEESTFRRAFVLVSPDALDRVLGTLKLLQTA